MMMNSAAPADGDSFFNPNSSQILKATESDIQRDHGDRPLVQGDQARIWRHTSLEGVELLQGSYRNYEFARHFHRVPAIGVVDRGSMSSYCRSEHHILGTGTVLLLNPGEVHAPAPAGSLGWSFRMFYLEERIFESVTSNVSMQNLRFQQPFVQDGKLAASLFQLHLELEENGDRLCFESLLLSIFSRLTERYAEDVSPSAQPKSDRIAIDMARQYLEANYHRNLSLTELANLSSFSASHFLRMFRDIVGLTPHAYLTQLRVEFATSLLRIGTPLVEVANLAGFADQSHFTKKFKRILGITPGQYILTSKSSRQRARVRSCRQRIAEQRNNPQA